VRHRCGLRRNLDGKVTEYKTMEKYVDKNGKCYIYAKEKLEFHQEIRKIIRNIRKKE